MLIKNEHYNPNWEVIHGYHEKERDRVLKEMKSWQQDISKTKNYDELEELKVEFGFHQNICAKCLHQYQHEYVADFAEYLFANASLDISASDFPPAESFKTVEEVMQAWKRLKEL